MKLDNDGRKRGVAGLIKPGALFLALVDLMLLALLAFVFVWLLYPESKRDQVVKAEQSTSALDTVPLTLSEDPETTHVTVVSGLESRAVEQFDDRFVKIDAHGEQLPAEAPQWSCVLDRQKRVVWEVKTNDGSWRDAEHTYSWFSVDAEGLQSGLADSGDCLFISCDTRSYVAEMNRRRYCGLNGWRLPTQLELQSLDHPVNFSPDIDREYFPFTRSGQYWSGSENKFSRELAWSVDFSNGISYVREKRLSCHLRAVAPM